MLCPDTDKDGLKIGEKFYYKNDPTKLTRRRWTKDGEEVLTYKTDPTKADTT